MKYFKYDNWLLVVEIQTIADESYIYPLKCTQSVETYSRNDRWGGDSPVDDPPEARPLQESLPGATKDLVRTIESLPQLLQPDPDLETKYEADRLLDLYCSIVEIDYKVQRVVQNLHLIPDTGAVSCLSQLVRESSDFPQKIYVPSWYNCSIYHSRFIDLANESLKSMRDGYKTTAIDQLQSLRSTGRNGRNTPGSELCRHAFMEGLCNALLFTHIRNQKSNDMSLLFTPLPNSRPKYLQDSPRVTGSCVRQSQRNTKMTNISADTALSTPTHCKGVLKSLLALITKMPDKSR
ncbi:hypothetical protein TREMEDRAFT_65084 [Tremella mesenterica DSM 1558]|uniref:uncharacterized protein n=1 Tax=Tremella mesenterica (strain ATCC 24925 / CBS 8224 / DSM 1558 / NBRC 9311 / NRRL Y-6157 / RJB 2259-6 / UBC 559-6) TaxID=578456 RepID=UPI00032C3792|nr:uncharacterized protein TREMEDRAFT_65084 [Tremella mesenterica DSM 1558]EIW66692.1 hypothetical protein TREMEDRAFT_65084 [Tremella mesenterica DSM 1558]